MRAAGCDTELVMYTYTYVVMLFLKKINKRVIIKIVDDLKGMTFVLLYIFFKSSAFSFVSRVYELRLKDTKSVPKRSDKG